MSDPTVLIVAALAGLAAVAIVASATLTGWRDWIRLQQETTGRSVPDRSVLGHDGSPSAGARIELADLRERIRKLEAIAAGVDL